MRGWLITAAGAMLALLAGLSPLASGVVRAGDGLGDLLDATGETVDQVVDGVTDPLAEMVTDQERSGQPAAISLEAGDTTGSADHAGVSRRSALGPSSGTPPMPPSNLPLAPDAVSAPLLSAPGVLPARSSDAGYSHVGPFESGLTASSELGADGSWLRLIAISAPNRAGPAFEVPVPPG